MEVPYNLHFDRSQYAGGGIIWEPSSSGYLEPSQYSHIEYGSVYPKYYDNCEKAEDPDICYSF